MRQVASRFQFHWEAVTGRNQLEKEGMLGVQIDWNGHKKEYEVSYYVEITPPHSCSSDVNLDDVEYSLKGKVWDSESGCWETTDEEERISH